MRLIDVDNVISVAEGEFSEEDVSKIRWLLSHIGTAYDIDKVVEELKDLGTKYCINVGCEYECKDCSHGVFMKKAIEIVKQGVKEQKYAG